MAYSMDLRGDSRVLSAAMVVDPAEYRAYPEVEATRIVPTTYNAMFFSYVYLDQRLVSNKPTAHRYSTGG